MEKNQSEGVGITQDGGGKGSDGGDVANDSIVPYQVEPTPDKNRIMSPPLSSLVISSEDKQNGDPVKDKNTNPSEMSDQAKDHSNVPINVGKRVRFSICEYITETLVQVHESYANGSHENPAFLNEDEMKNRNSDLKGLEGDETGGSKVRYIGGRVRRDSVHPLVQHQTQNTNFANQSPWDVVTSNEDDEKPTETPWSELSTKQKLLRVLTGIGKFLGLLALLYFFVCSLDLLSLGFRLIGGRTAGEIFRSSSILQNPVVGLMIGILTTVLVQSSSTSTSIIVGMVAAGFMDVRTAVPPIMGANIGTSITNTIVSFTQAGDREQFRRAFAGATILDMFNWITVVVLLPIEVMFGYLYHVSKASVDLIIPDSQSSGEIQVLSVITKPFVDLIVQLNDTVLECWATPNCTDADDASLIKTFCSTVKTDIYVQGRVTDRNGKEILNINDVARQEDLQKCDFLFAGTGLSDAGVGAIILVASLLVLCFCLVMIVKLLNSVLEGHVSKIIKHVLNADIPYVPWITGYIAIFIGAMMTFLVQSSSVFTSALTPLVGLGVISVERVYPLTLGANIGTTTTALLASMAAEGKSLHPSLQIALCHFYFNITGVILFYPVPFLRFPIAMAKVLGNITAKYRWFAIFYLVSMFAVLPVVFISLSLAGSIYVIILVSIVGVIILLVALLTILQRKVPGILPQILRDWKWLPRPLRSLQPYDKIISTMACCRSKTDDEEESEEISDDDDGFLSYKGRSNIYKNSDFVFLSGNKIPPPNDYNKEQEQHQHSPRRSITRIVPTRVIRNISNANGDFIPVMSSVPPVNEGMQTTSGVTSNGNTSPNVSTNGANSSSLSNNTLPIPAAFEEESQSQSTSNQNLDNGNNGESANNGGYSSGRSNSIPAPAYNLGYSNTSLESFSV